MANQIKTNDWRVDGGHVVFEESTPGWTRSGFERRESELYARYVTHQGEPDVVQIGIGISEFKGEKLRKYSMCDSLTLTSEQARELALAICPELAKPINVVVSLHGGVATGLWSDAPGVNIVVQDYDTEGADLSDTIADRDGMRYFGRAEEMEQDAQRVAQTFMEARAFMEGVKGWKS